MLSLPTQHEQIYFPNLAQGFLISNVAQVKKMNYCDQHPTNEFLPLGFEVFGYLHK
jgi:hypothetical protein